MEQLQRQQEAKLEMSLQEKHLLQAQLMFAQQAAAARASSSKLDSALFGKADGQTYQQILNHHLSRMQDPEEDEDEEDDDDDSDKEERGVLGPDDNFDEDDDEEEGDEESGSHPQAKKPRLQPASNFPFRSYLPAAAAKQLSESPPSAVKQEHEEVKVMSPTSQPNGFPDWGYDEPCKQVRDKMKVCVLSFEVNSGLVWKASDGLLVLTDVWSCCGLCVCVLHLVINLSCFHAESLLFLTRGGRRSAPVFGSVPNF